MRAYAFFYLYGNDPLPRQRYRDALPRLFCARLSRAEPLCVRAPWAHPTSALPPCVDGSELARTFLNVCSIGRCSHVFGLLARHVGPLAIMPCTDQPAFENAWGKVG